MKIAIIYTGFLRTFNSNFHNHYSNILSKYDTDVFVSTWKSQEDNHIVDESEFQIFGENLKKISIFDEDVYKERYLKKFEIFDREDDIFKIDYRAVEANKPYGGPQYWVNRLMSQWFLVKKGFELIKNSNHYDLILRVRFDLFFTNFELQKTDSLVVPYSPAEHQGLQPFNDHLAYGNYENMKIYCDLYESMLTLYKNYNFDISYAEKVLKFHLDTNKTKIERTNNINYIINK
jgi:hypothetical protein